LARDEGNSRTSTISRLATAPGGPGRTFKLTEDALLAALERHAEVQPDVRPVASAGVPQLAARGDPKELALVALASYYAGYGREVASSAQLDGRLVERDDALTAAGGVPGTVAADQAPRAGAGAAAPAPVGAPR
jgi:hypothetical protein